jgi:Ca2+-binding EF-hand superfamily protein
MTTIRPAATPRYTVLQRHAGFFDTNGDHKITMPETRQSLKDLGMPSWLTPIIALGINLGFGFQNAGRPSLTIDIDKITRTRNRSHTGAFDANGDFDQAAFDRMLDVYDVNRSGSLSESEIQAMLAANRKDPVGGLASQGEFRMLMAVGADTTEGSQQAISRKALKSFYDGTLLYDLAARRGKPHTPPAGLEVTD